MGLAFSFGNGFQLKNSIEIGNLCEKALSFQKAIGKVKYMLFSGLCKHNIKGCLHISCKSRLRFEVGQVYKHFHTHTLGVHSQHFIFFVTYELAQKASVIFADKPSQPSVL